MKRQTHLTAARRHGRQALAELRHMTADSALYWVLGHKDRVTQFKRAIKGTRAAKPFETLLTRIRGEATALARPARRRVAKRRRMRTRRSVMPRYGLL